MEQEIILYFPDTAECNDFIAILEEYELSYYLIGRNEWQMAVKSKLALGQYWLNREEFTLDRLLPICRRIINSFPAGSTFRLVGFNERYRRLQDHLEGALRSGRDRTPFPNKWEIIRTAQDAGLPVVPTALASDFENFLQTQPSTRGYVVKPNVDFMATGVIALKDASAVRSWARSNIGQLSNYILQHFVPGIVYHIDGIIRNTKLSTYFCGKNMSTQFRLGRKGVSYKSMMLNGQAEVSKRLLTLHEKLRRTFNIQDACSHLVFILDASGSISFCEATIRTPIAGLLELHEYYHGKSPLGLYAASLGNKKALHSRQYRGEPGRLLVTPKNIVKFEKRWEFLETQVANQLRV